MNITASNMAEGNPGGGIANLLQMIQTMSAGRPSQAGANLVNPTAESADENPFSGILLQQIALLLQTGGVGLSDAPTKDELAAAIKKFLEGDSTQTDAGMSGLAMLAVAGQQLLEASGNNIAGIQEEASAVNGENGAAGSSAMTKDFLPGGKLTSVIVGAIRDYIQDAGAKGDDGDSVQTGSLQGKDVTAKTLKREMQKDASGSGNAGAKFAEEIKSLLKNENGDVKRSEMASLKEAATDGSHAKAGEKTASFSDADLKISSEQLNNKMNEMAASATDGRSARENAFVDSRIGQAGVHIKSVVPDGKVKASGSQENTDQGDSLKMSGVTETGAQDVKKKIPADEEMLRKNFRMDAEAVRESKTGAAGKDMRQGTPATTESQSAGETFKTELKTKTAVFDRNAENDHLNSATPSSGVTKTAGKEEINSTSIINRVAAEFRENGMNEGGRIKVTLTPPSLGSLEMDVSVQNNKVRVMLIAESKDVQRVLSGNIETLKTTLQTQGLTIERCDVMMQDSRDEYPQGFNGQQSFGHEQAARERNSRPETVDDKPLRGKAALHVHNPVSRPQHTGSESISLFA